MKKRHTKIEKLGFILTAYERCFDSKHHYDNLSWSIGGILLVYVGALLAYFPHIKGGWQFLGFLLFSPQRLVMAFFSCMFLYLWLKIYERNRFWAEVANEKIREFEREFQVEGVGIKFMKANNDKFVVLENVDENGKPVGEKRKEWLKTDAMPVHRVIRWFFALIAVAIFLACFIP